MSLKPELRIRQIRQLLEIESSFGMSEIPGRRAQEIAELSKANALEQLYEKFKNCMRCPLSATRTKLVFGDGSAETKLLFVGEAPGFEEDRQGKPFVGAAGQLLTKILEAMKLSREDVYIANCLKCRPPQNRTPQPEELSACNPILARQIEIIRPTVICALGKVAAQTLLSTDESISRLRGKFFDRNGVKIMPTFHPAYLLRNPADKKLVWQDMKLIMKELEL